MAADIIVSITAQARKPGYRGLCGAVWGCIKLLEALGFRDMSYGLPKGGCIVDYMGFRF